MNNQKNWILKILLFGMSSLILAGGINAQIVTNEEMANLELAHGYTGVGKFPPLAVALPKDDANQAYLLVKDVKGWKKRKFDCLRGVSLSNDGKVWVVSSQLVDGQCIYKYDLNYSSNGGRTWSSSQGFNPSLSGGGQFVRLDVDKKGDGKLVIWSENSEDDHGFYYLISVSKNKNLKGLKKWETNTTNPNGNTIGSIPEPAISKGNIVAISNSSFSNSDTYGAASEWLPKLAKIKGKERKQFPN